PPSRRLSRPAVILSAREVSPLERAGLANGAGIAPVAPSPREAEAPIVKTQLETSVVGLRIAGILHTTRTVCVPLRASCGVVSERSTEIEADEAGIDLAGDVALQTADGLLGGLALLLLASDVVLRGLVAGHPHEHDPPQGFVGLPVATSVEPVPALLAGGGVDRRRAAQGSE